MAGMLGGHSGGISPVYSYQRITITEDEAQAILGWRTVNGRQRLEDKANEELRLKQSQLAVEPTAARLTPHTINPSAARLNFEAVHGITVSSVSGVNFAAAKGTSKNAQQSRWTVRTVDASGQKIFLTFPLPVAGDANFDPSRKSLDVARDEAENAVRAYVEKDGGTESQRLSFCSE